MIVLVSLVVHPPASGVPAINEADHVSHLSETLLVHSLAGARPGSNCIV